MPHEHHAAAAELPDRPYPLTLMTGRVLYHWHGGDMTRRVPGLVSRYPQVLASIHPDDAAAAGLTDGAPVRVTSRRGEIDAVTHVTDEVRRGEVFIPFVQLEGVAANLLTNNAYDPRAKIPEYKVCAIRIAPR
jgi:predicted molibdopterin-dependent oxidoreductase YjgC